MVNRREYFRLEEVRAELQGLGVPDPDIALISDLQQNVLAAFVDFPDIRAGQTQIPQTAWLDVESEIARGLPRHRRRGAWEGFCFTVNDFFPEEEELLRQTILAVALRDFDSIPATYRQHLAEKFPLNSKMTEKDCQSLISWCGFSWRRLSELDGRTMLQPVVKSHQMNAYLLSVKKDRALVGKSLAQKHAGGRPESPHWLQIFEMAVRKLATRSTPMQSGDVQEFAGHLHTALKKIIGEDKERLPTADTIAQRLRTVLKPDAD